MSKITIDTDDWIPILQAAKIRGITRQAISKLVKKKRFRTLLIGGYLLLNRHDVKNYTPENAGRPRKDKKSK